MADKNFSQFTESADSSEIAFLVGYLTAASGGERRIAIANFLTEQGLIGTERQFSKGQGLTNTALTSVSNETDIDFEDGNSFILNMDEDTELQIPTNNRPQSVQIEVTNSGGNTLTFESGYIVVGDTPSTTDGDKILLCIASFGNSTPWITVKNQP